MDDDATPGLSGEEKLVEYRLERLLRAGYSGDAALELSVFLNADLHLCESALACVRAAHVINAEYTALWLLGLYDER